MKPAMTGAEMTAHVLEAVETARTRDDVVDAYALCLPNRPGKAQPDWKKVNQAILDRWSRAGLEYIKGAAWRR